MIITYSLSPDDLYLDTKIAWYKLHAKFNFNSCIQFQKIERLMKFYILKYFAEKCITCKLIISNSAISYSIIFARNLWFICIPWLLIKFSLNLWTLLSLNAVKMHLMHKQCIKFCIKLVYQPCILTTVNHENNTTELYHKLNHRNGCLVNISFKQCPTYIQYSRFYVI